MVDSAVDFVGDVAINRRAARNGHDLHAGANTKCRQITRKRVGHQCSLERETGVNGIPVCRSAVNFGREGIEPAGDDQAAKRFKVGVARFLDIGNADRQSARLPDGIEIGRAQGVVGPLRE